MLCTFHAALGIMITGWGGPVLVLKFRIVVRFSVSFPGKFGGKSLATNLTKKQRIMDCNLQLTESKR